MSHVKGRKKQSIEIVPERPEHIFKELKGILSKELKEENRDMYYKKRTK